MATLAQDLRGWTQEQMAAVLSDFESALDYQHRARLSEAERKFENEARSIATEVSGGAIVSTAKIRVP